jgi:hypothetical protein
MSLKVREAPKIQGSHGCLRRRERMYVSGGFGASHTSPKILQYLFIIIVVFTMEFESHCDFHKNLEVVPSISP